MTSPTVAAMTAAATAATTTRWRRPNVRPRSSQPAGLATIGAPSRERCRSSARSRADADQPEVGHVGAPRPIARLEQDVARLEIAMDEPDAVRGVHGLGDIATHEQLLLERELRRRLVEPHAVDVLHRDVRAAAQIADLV